MNNFIPATLTLMLLLTACQPKPNEVPTAEITEQKPSIALIQARTERVQLPHNEVCEAATEEDFASCTKYHLQTIRTGVDWLDQYFLQRLKQDHTEAFAQTPAVKVTLDPEMPSTNYSTASVRYIGQHAQLASFEYFSDYFPAGAAHGMHHKDYVIFDLNSKQRLTLNDILQPAAKEQLQAELYSYNQDWLEQHHIEANELEVSDNFYYGANGIIFVYPLYELASYAEGISELELPYWSAQSLIKPEYLPQLPESSEEIYDE